MPPHMVGGMGQRTISCSLLCRKVTAAVKEGWEGEWEQLVPRRNGWGEGQYGSSTEIVNRGDQYSMRSTGLGK